MKGVNNMGEFIQGAVGKVVDAWRKEGVFPQDAMAHFRDFVDGKPEIVTHSVCHAVEQPPPAVTVGELAPLISRSNLFS